jgi:hypothetical protein
MLGAREAADMKTMSHGAMLICSNVFVSTFDMRSCVQHRHWWGEHAWETLNARDCVSAGRSPPADAPTSPKSLVRKAVLRTIA